MLSFSHIHVGPPAERPTMVRDDFGAWREASTGILGAGARDVTLGERVDPLVSRRSSGAPEYVTISLAEIVANPDLNWVLQSGTRLDGWTEPLFLVPWAVWQEQSVKAVDVWLPAFDADGVDRAAALAEHMVRLAKKAWDDAGLMRIRMILLATYVGRTRRDVGITLGLSPGRIQQLKEAASDELIAEVERFVQEAIAIATALGESACPLEDLPSPKGFGPEHLAEVVSSMIECGLLDESPEGLRVTEDGRGLIGAADRTSSLKAEPFESTSGRAGHATQ